MEPTDRREQIRGQLALTGLDPDEASLDALVPAVEGLMNGVRRLNTLDLGETEPALTFGQARREERG